MSEMLPMRTAAARCAKAVKNVAKSNTNYQ